MFLLVALAALALLVLLIVGSAQAGHAPAVSNVTAMEFLVNQAATMHVVVTNVQNDGGAPPLGLNETTVFAPPGIHFSTVGQEHQGPSGWSVSARSDRVRFSAPVGSSGLAGGQSTTLALRVAHIDARPQDGTANLTIETQSPALDRIRSDLPLSLRVLSATLLVVEPAGARDLVASNGTTVTLRLAVKSHASVALSSVQANLTVRMSDRFIDNTTSPVPVAAAIAPNDTVFFSFNLRLDPRNGTRALVGSAFQGNATTGPFNGTLALHVVSPAVLRLPANNASNTTWQAISNGTLPDVQRATDLWVRLENPGDADVVLGTPRLRLLRAGAGGSEDLSDRFTIQRIDTTDRVAGRSNVTLLWNVTALRTLAFEGEIDAELRVPWGDANLDLTPNTLAPAPLRGVFLADLSPPRVTSLSVLPSGQAWTVDGNNVTIYATFDDVSRDRGFVAYANVSRTFHNGTVWETGPMNRTGDLFWFNFSTNLTFLNATFLPSRFDASFPNHTEFVGAWNARVEGVDGAGFRAFSEMASFHIQDGVPPQIANVNVTPRTQPHVPGTTVNLSAEVFDNIRVAAVRATVTRSVPSEPEPIVVLDDAPMRPLAVDANQGGTYTLVAPFPPGELTLRVTAVDGSGTSNLSAPFSFSIVDTNPPSIGRVRLDGVERLAASSTRTIHLTVEASDDDAVHHVDIVVRDLHTRRSVAVDANATLRADGTYVTRLSRGEGSVFERRGPLPLPEGSYEIQATAFDWNLNARSSPPAGDWQLFVDNTPPRRPELIAPADGAILTARPTLSWTHVGGLDREATDGYHVMLDTTPEGGSPNARRMEVRGATEVAVDLPDGIWHWRVVAFDLAGNENATGVRSFTIDSSAPVLRTRPASGGFVRTGGSVVVEAQDLTLSRLTVTSGGVVLYSGQEPLVTVDTLTWTSGRRTIEIDAVDEAGNAARQVAEFQIDNQPPRTSLATPPRAVASPLSIPLTASDDRSGVRAVWVSVNGSAFAPLELLHLNQSGRYEVSYYAEDGAGNAEAPRNFTVVVDFDAPRLEPPAGGRPSRAAVGEPFAIAVRATDLSLREVTARVTVDGREVARLVLQPEGRTGVHSASYAPTREGLHQIRLEATDEAGNVGTQTFEVSVGNPLWTLLAVGALAGAVAIVALAVWARRRRLREEEEEELSR